MKPGELTGRHLEAAQMALDGMTTAHIAGKLGLSAAAAARLLDEVYAKVGVHNRTELREQWIRDGWKAALARIRRFVEDHGHSRMPRDYVDEDGHLEGLVQNLRHLHAGLAGNSPGPFPGIDYASDLDALDGWEWQRCPPNAPDQRLGVTATVSGGTISR